MTRFLIADDSPTVRAQVREWLISAGYDVLEAADGLRALQLLRANTQFLAVLLDYDMPGLTGYEVLQQARAHGYVPPRYAYAVISGRPEAFPPAFTDLLRQLAIQMLPKPFDRDTLLMLAAYLTTRQGAPGR
jgi:two-component system, chemotaxis family, chemotaxis protein CheY